MNKVKQKYLDKIITHQNITYKEMYLKPKIETMLFLVSNVNQCEILLKRYGVDIRTENGYKSTYDVLKQLTIGEHLCSGRS